MELDEDLFCIQVAKELGVPVTAVDDLPEHWLYAVRTYWEWQRREAKQSRRHAARQRQAA